MDILITNEPEKWEIYEREKAEIKETAISNDDYVEKLVALIKRLEL